MQPNIMSCLIIGLQLISILRNWKLVLMEKSALMEEAWYDPSHEGPTGGYLRPNLMHWTTGPIQEGSPTDQKQKSRKNSNFLLWRKNGEEGEETKKKKKKKGVSMYCRPKQVGNRIVTKKKRVVPTFIKLILNRINFVKIDLVIINFEIK